MRYAIYRFADSSIFSFFFDVNPQNIQTNFDFLVESDGDILKRITHTIKKKNSKNPIYRLASSASPAAYFFSEQPIFSSGCAFRAAASSGQTVSERNGFQNETVLRTKRLKNGAEQHRAERPHKTKSSVFQTKAFQSRCKTTPRKKAEKNNKRLFSKLKRPVFVSLRGAQRRGNL